MRYHLSRKVTSRPFSFYDWRDVSITVSLTLLGIWILFSVYMLCKISKLSAALTMIPTTYGTPVSTSPPQICHPNFLIYERPSALAKNLSAIPLNLNLDLTYHATFIQLLLMACIIMNLIAIFVVLLKKSRKQEQVFGCALCINFSDSLESVLICVQKFGDVSTNYEFYCDHFIANVEVRNILNPKVYLQWQLQIVHKYAERSIKFRKEISVSFSLARKMKRILQTEHFLAVPLLRDENQSLSPLVMLRTSQIDYRERSNESAATAPIHNDRVLLGESNPRRSMMYPSLELP